MCPTFKNLSQDEIEAIRARKTRYAPPAGMPSLREALAEDAGLGVLRDLAFDSSLLHWRG